MKIQKTIIARATLSLSLVLGFLVASASAETLHYPAVAQKHVGQQVDLKNSDTVNQNQPIYPKQLAAQKQLAPSKQQLSQKQLASKKHAGAKPYVKPGAPVRLLNPNGYTLTAGVPLSVDLGLALGNGVTNVTLVPSKHLSLLSSDSFEFVNQRSVNIPLQVLTEVTELAHINLFVEHKTSEGQRTTRALAVVFDSRTRDELRRAKVKPAPDIMIMPAQETIR